jgi:uncharacterized protein
MCYSSNRVTRNATRVLWLAIIAALLAVPALAETPLPAPSGFVNDFTGVVDEASRARMETMSRNFRDRTAIDIAVVTLKSLDGRPVEDVAIDLARQWGIGGGQDKDGVLVLLAVDDRKIRVETSRKIDDEITDGTASAIARKGSPYFREGRYGEGLAVILESLFATIAEKRGISIEGIDQSRAYREVRQQPARGGSSGLSRIIFYLVVGFVIISILRGFGGGGGGRGGRRRRYGGGMPWIIPFPLGGGGGGWSGGSSGGWGGGGGESWGGFGGGGDFGGGGGTDSW